MKECYPIQRNFSDSPILGRLVPVLICLLLSISANPGSCIAQVSPGYTADTLSLAESYLDHIATKREKQRIRASAVGMGIGVLSVAGGIALVSESEPDDPFPLTRAYGLFFIIEGAGIIILSAVTFSILTPHEKKRRKVMAISETQRRDQAAHQALHDLARKARTNRIINSVFSSIALVCLIGSEDYEMDIFVPLLAGSIMINLAGKSFEEKELKKYQDETGIRSDAVDFSVGLLPTGGGVVRARINF